MSRSEKIDLVDCPPLLITLSYLKALATYLAVFLVLCLFWSGSVIFSLSDLWSRNADIMAGLGSVWLIFVWAAVVPLAIGLKIRKRPRDHEPLDVLRSGFLASLNAGIFEELIYRWLRFSIALILLPVMNFLLFGFMPDAEGVLHWLYKWVFVPFADFATFGTMHDLLFHPASWVVGAAIISANGAFYNDHQYNGVFNQINAWFIGMALFYVMFHYGLLTAIVAHILYDAIVFGCAALTMTWRPQRVYNRFFMFRA